MFLACCGVRSMAGGLELVQREFFSTLCLLCGVGFVQSFDWLQSVNLTINILCYVTILLFKHCSCFEIAPI